jgi:beta-phosphoglucomutase family hydrolase
MENDAHYTAFIFDMDGTLIDNMRVHNRIWIDLLASKGIFIEEEEFHRQTTGKTTPEILRILFGSRMSEEELARFAEHKEQIYRDKFRPFLQPVTGAQHFLVETRRLGVAVGLATSAGKKNIEYVLSGTALSVYFDVVVSGEDVRRGKPDPEIFLLAAQRLNVPARECLVFEDSPLGIEAARLAGMQAVAITTTIPQDEFLKLNNVIRAAKDFTDLEPCQFARVCFDPIQK